MKAFKVIGIVTYHDGNPVDTYKINPIVNSWVYAVILPDHAIQKYSANFISENLYSQVDKKGHIYTLMDEIMDHRKEYNAVTKWEGYTEDSNGRRIINITTKGWIFLVNRKDWIKYCITLKDKKQSLPNRSHGMQQVQEDR